MLNTDKPVHRPHDQAAVSGPWLSTIAYAPQDKANNGYAEGRTIAPPWGLHVGSRLSRGATICTPDRFRRLTRVHHNIVKAIDIIQRCDRPRSCCRSSNSGLPATHGLDRGGCYMPSQRVGVDWKACAVRLITANKDGKNTTNLECVDSLSILHVVHEMHLRDQPTAPGKATAPFDTLPVACHHNRTNRLRIIMI